MRAAAASSDHHTQMHASGSFPRRQAATRRFTLGAPRDFRVSSAGDRVLFLRSGGPVDPVNSLWEFDPATAAERLVVDAAALGADETDLPPEERARRERARESGGGIVAFDATADLAAVVFAIGGQLARADVATGVVSMLPTAAGVFDPRLSPDGQHVAYVSSDALRAIVDGEDRLIAQEAASTVSWGSAEFVAGEEMGRTRGYWWSPQSDALLVERVDVAPVEEWWISAPVSPAEAPTPVRYPAAGTANAQVSLAIVSLHGDTVAIDWPPGGWEYLASASWDDDGIWLTMQSRDQRTLAVFQADPSDGSVSEMHRIEDDHWVELIPGTPARQGGRLITVEDRGAARRLCVDGEAITGDGVQIRGVISVDADGVVVAASREPTSVHVGCVGWDGTIAWVTEAAGVHGAVIGGPAQVRVSRSLAFDGAQVSVVRAGVSIGTITDHSERPDVSLNMKMLRLGDRELAAALLLPNGVADDARLPVLLDPYGGPHAQRVQQSRSLFHASQWFADQGFAVLVTDGRGTPGRGPAFERAVRGDLAAPVLDDQVDALRAAAVLEPRLDLTRVAIRGWSFGGYLAALAVLRRPDVFHAAVAGAPVTDWRLYDTHYTERYLGHPDTEPENYERTDLTVEPASLDPGVPFPPLLMIHGLADDNVVAAHTLKLSRSLLEAGRAHTVLPLSGVTHMTPQEEVAENLLLVQLAFLREALGKSKGTSDE
jgi:dipeptidyl-peptidase-4